MRMGENNMHRANFNCVRPHQGIEQQVPDGSSSVREKQGKGKIIAFPVLNGLHHYYRLAAKVTGGGDI